jgi:transposase-like protein
VSKQVDRAAVKRAYLDSTDSMAQVAQRFGLTSRTVERWASEEGWAAERKGRSLSNEPAKAVVTEVLPTEPMPKPQPIARRRATEQIDELEIIDTAILDIRAAMGGGSDSVDLRSLGSAASGLCRLVELRLKLQPKTAADLAKQAMQLGIKPETFLQALAEQWQQQA